MKSVGTRSRIVSRISNPDTTIICRHQALLLTSRSEYINQNTKVVQTSEAGAFLSARCACPPHITFHGARARIRRRLNWALGLRNSSFLDHRRSVSLPVYGHTHLRRLHAAPIAGPRRRRNSSIAQPLRTAGRSFSPHGGRGFEETTKWTAACCAQSNRLGPNVSQKSRLGILTKTRLDSDHRLGARSTKRESIANRQ